MTRTLNSLDSRFRPTVCEFLARCVEAQIQVMIINTLRTAEEQAEALRTGHSKVVRSRHQDGLAIDVCPFETFQLHGPDKLQWNTEDPIWRQMGELGEALGMRWGGRFLPLNTHGIGWDPGHFEYKGMR